MWWAWGIYKCLLHLLYVITITNSAYVYFLHLFVCQNSTNLYINPIHGGTVNRERLHMNHALYFKLIIPDEYYSIVFLTHSLITFRHTEKIEKWFFFSFLPFLFSPPHSINAHYKTKKRQLLIMGIGIQTQKHFSTSFKLFSSNFWSVLLLRECCVLSYSSLINRWRATGGPDKALFREQTRSTSCLWCPRVEFS